MNDNMTSLIREIYINASIKILKSNEITRALYKKMY